MYIYIYIYIYIYVYTYIQSDESIKHETLLHIHYRAR